MSNHLLSGISETRFLMRQKGKKIIIIEHDDTTLKIVKYFCLKHFIFDVLTFTDPNDFSKYIWSLNQEEVFSIFAVITDIVFPQGDLGFDVIEVIKEHILLKHVQVCTISSYSGHIESSIISGIPALEKPLSEKNSILKIKELFYAYESSFIPQSKKRFLQRMRNIYFIERKEQNITFFDVDNEIFSVQNEEDTEGKRKESEVDFFTKDFDLFIKGHFLRFHYKLYANSAYINRIVYNTKRIPYLEMKNKFISTKRFSQDLINNYFKDAQDILNLSAKNKFDAEELMQKN